MPRDGSGIYTQPFPDVVAGTTIESAKYNGNVNDVEQDLNTPRPIVAGGTGATSAGAARLSLAVEASRQPITNYDGFPLMESGSFYSIPGATAAPNATNRFAGIYYANADGSYATAEARDQTTGILYIRKRIAGVWDATWTEQTGGVTAQDTRYDTRYVNTTGDTMSGPLGLQYGAGAIRKIQIEGTVTPAISFSDALNATSHTFSNNGNVTTAGVVTAGKYVATSSRIVSRGTTVAAQQPSVGVHNGAIGYCMVATSANQLALAVADADGAPVVTPFWASETSGNTSQTGNISAGGYVTTLNVITTAVGGAYALVSTDPANTVNLIRAVPGSGAYAVTQQAIFSAGVWGGHEFGITANASFQFRQDASAVKSGGSTAWLITSDARIKNVLGDYTNGLDAIAALRPVRYTLKGNETDEAPAHVKSGETVPEHLINEPVAVPYGNSMNYGPAVAQREYIGLVAQEAEIPLPETVTKGNGYIDGAAVTDLRSMDHSPLIFALINAVKELKARVEELEATR